jgi:acyl-coenzyme A thioesterase PaaI-like protein
VPSSKPAFQELIPGNNCFGCGPENELGLQIKSYWDGPEEASCVFEPQPHQNAGPKQFLNGGIIATLVDCHSVCTAVADAYRREGRAVGSQPLIWYVTASLAVTYQRPTPIAAPVELRARVARVDGTKSYIRCSVRSGGTERVVGEVLAVRVSTSWQDPV